MARPARARTHRHPDREGPLVPLIPRKPLLGPGGPPQPAGPPGLPPSLPPGPGMDPSGLAGGGPPPGPPGLGGPPPGLLGGPLAGPGGIGGSQYPSTDPSSVAGLLAPLEQAQAQDQQAFQGQQMEAAVLALIDAMKNQPNPAAQAAMTEPGYPTPPPPAGAM